VFCQGHVRLDMTFILLPSLCSVEADAEPVESKLGGG
jgi:hypothetical protein